MKTFHDLIENRNSTRININVMDYILLVSKTSQSFLSPHSNLSRRLHFGSLVFPSKFLGFRLKLVQLLTPPVAEIIRQEHLKLVQFPKPTKHLCQICYSVLWQTTIAYGRRMVFSGRRSGQSLCAGQADSYFLPNMSLLPVCIQLRWPIQTQ